MGSICCVCDCFNCLWFMVGLGGLGFFGGLVVYIVLAVVLI